MQPHHHAERAYEQLSAFFNLVSMMGTGAFAVARPAPRRRPSGRASSPPGRLPSRAGGHAAVRDEVVEDVHLARRYRAAGLPVRCLAGGDAVGFRMYPGGVRQLVEGGRRTSRRPAPAVAPVGPGGAVAWVRACRRWRPRRRPAWPAGASATAPPVAPAVAWAAVAAQVVAAAPRRPFRWWWAALPVPLVAFLALFFADRWRSPAAPPR